jgi:hypothetical protein
MPPTSGHDLARRGSSGRSEVVQNRKVVPIHVAQLVAGVEHTLRFDRDAGDRPVAKSPNSEERARQLVPPTADRSLARIPLSVDQERMHVNPPPPRRRELHAVGAPVGLDRVAQASKRSKHVLLKRLVNVHVDIAVSPSLATDKGIDAPAPFEPEPAADRTHGVQHREHLAQGHS